MKRGKFIVIEGVDGSGKATQFRLLYKRLKKSGAKVSKIKFPRYKTSVWGKMLSDLLSGKRGDFINTTSYLTVFPYMVDEYTWGRDIGEKLLSRGENIISDRYFTSNVHQVAKLTRNKRRVYRKWLWNAGYNKLGIIKPDIVLFLDVHPRISRKLMEKRSLDTAEKNYDHQVEAYKEYCLTVKNNNYWFRVRCVTKGLLDTPEEISERISKLLRKKGFSH